MRYMMILPAAALAAASLGATAAEAITTVSGPATFIAGDRVAAEFRNGDGLGGGAGEAEIYVSPDANAGDGTPRGTKQLPWDNKTYEFSFSYDSTGGFGGGGLLTASVIDGATTYSAVYGDDEAVSSSLGFNAMEFYIANSNTGAGDSIDNGEFLLSNVTLNGAAVGGGSFGVIDANQILHFSTSLFTDFVLAGDMTRSGFDTDTNFRPGLSVKVGNVNVIPLPAGAWVLISGFAAAAGLRRMTRKAA